MSAIVRGLDEAARVTLHHHRITQASWRRLHFGAEATTWLGDRCGCPDDRCIDYHHDEHEDCLCLLALIVDHNPQDLREGSGA